MLSNEEHKGCLKPAKGVEMRPSAKWQLVLRQFNGEFIIINLWEQKKDSHVMKPGFIMQDQVSKNLHSGQQSTEL